MEDVAEEDEFTVAQLELGRICCFVVVLLEGRSYPSFRLIFKVIQMLQASSSNPEALKPFKRRCFLEVIEVHADDLSSHRSFTRSVHTPRRNEGERRATSDETQLTEVVSHSGKATRLPGPSLIFMDRIPNHREFTKDFTPNNQVNPCVQMVERKARGGGFTGQPFRSTQWQTWLSWCFWFKML